MLAGSVRGAASHSSTKGADKKLRNRIARMISHAEHTASIGGRVIHLRITFQYFFDDDFHERWIFFQTCSAQRLYGKWILQSDFKSNVKSSARASGGRIGESKLLNDSRSLRSLQRSLQSEKCEKCWKLFSRNMLDSRLSCRDGWSIRLCLESTKMALSSERGSESWKKSGIIRYTRLLVWLTVFRQLAVGWGALVAPRILNDVSCITSINHPCHFSWRAQYLVMLGDDSCWSAHCKWRFMSQDDESSTSCCVSGGVFGDVGSTL